MATARNNPEFARRLVETMPSAHRSELAETLARPVADRPGLAKCVGSGTRSRADWTQPMSAQLNLFARSVSRI
jgi:hypothetical protein